MHSGHWGGGPESLASAIDGSVVESLIDTLTSVELDSAGGIVGSSVVIVVVVVIVGSGPVSASVLATEGSPPVVAAEGGTHTPPSQTNVDKHSPSTHVQLSLPGVQPVGTHLSIDAMHS